MFYIFHGDDEHSKRKYLAQLQEKLGDAAMADLNTSRLSSDSLSFSELRHICDSVPFLSERRVVIVDDLLSREPVYADDLLEYVVRIPETTRLVFLESKRLPSNHPMVLLANQDKSGYVKLFSRLEGRELALWIQKHVADAGGSISPKAAHLLSINVGSNLALMENELEKLLLYKNHEEIGADDVSMLCPYVAEASIFDLVDALGSRHRRTAAEMLHKKLEEGSDPSYLFSMIVRQYRLLIQVKELASAGHGPAEIAGALKIHGFVAGKLVHQSRNYESSQLDAIYAHLLETDIGVKTGKTDMITSLDLLVAGLVN
jgi:DNA polymerase-3 subunit delta